MELIQQSKYICMYDLGIKNHYGRFWNHMHRVIVGSMGSNKPRSGTYTTPWNNELDPTMALPVLRHIPDTLSDIADQRAIELATIAQQQNKKIYIMWSGGIDSTFVLVSFLKNLSVADHAMLAVVLTKESIDEAPVFYKDHIENKLEVIRYHSFVVDNYFLKSQGIVLSGDPADAIFGPSSGMYTHMMHDRGHLRSFRDHTKIIGNSIDQLRQESIRRYNLTGFGQWYAHKVTKNLLEVNPPEVETIADWWWWHYINLKWESSMVRPIIRRKISKYNEPLEQQQISNFNRDTFFNTEKFQMWSFTNLKTLIGNDVATHKAAPKQYIYEFDKNEDYYKNKKKIESVPASDNYESSLTHRPILWDKNWVGYYGDRSRDVLVACTEHLYRYKG